MISNNTVQFPSLSDDSNAKPLYFSQHSLGLQVIFTTSDTIYNFSKLSMYYPVLIGLIFPGSTSLFWSAKTECNPKFSCHRSALPTQKLYLLSISYAIIIAITVSMQKIPKSRIPILTSSQTQTTNRN